MLRRMSVQVTPEFTAGVRFEGDCAVLVLEGELDLGVRGPARDALDGTRDARVVVIDLRGLTFMDTSGIHLLLEARAQCRASGRMLLVVPGPAPVQRGLAALELEREFTFVAAP
jgi:anti-sigma B factor antagonist